MRLFNKAFACMQGAIRKGQWRGPLPQRGRSTCSPSHILQQKLYSTMEEGQEAQRMLGPEAVVPQRAGGAAAAALLQLATNGELAAERQRQGRMVAMAPVAAPVPLQCRSVSTQQCRSAPVQHLPPLPTLASSPLMLHPRPSPLAPALGQAWPAALGQPAVIVGMKRPFTAPTSSPASVEVPHSVAPQQRPASCYRLVPPTSSAAPVPSITVAVPVPPAMPAAPVPPTLTLPPLTPAVLTKEPLAAPSAGGQCLPATLANNGSGGTSAAEQVGPASVLQLERALQHSQQRPPAVSALSTPGPRGMAAAFPPPPAAQPADSSLPPWPSNGSSTAGAPRPEKRQCTDGCSGGCSSLPQGQSPTQPVAGAFQTPLQLQLQLQKLQPLQICITGCFTGGGSRAGGQKAQVGRRTRCELW
jgi:hypothetical protein